MIFFVDRLRDIFCGEVAFFLWRVHDFFMERLHDFFLLRGCVILCLERLRDFCVWRGGIFSLTHSGCLILV